MEHCAELLEQPGLRDAELLARAQASPEQASQAPRAFADQNPGQVFGGQTRQDRDHL